MAPFPTLRRPANQSSPSLLPTSMSYPPSPALSPSASSTSVNLVGNASNPSSPVKAHGSQFPIVKKSALPRKIQSTDPKNLFGGMGEPADGVLGGLGQTSESRRIVRECLKHNHLSHHIFFNDKGFHNHVAHRLLACYSLGAGPKLIQDMYKLDKLSQKPMLPLQLEQITESNWTHFLGQEKYYPNYLHFFTQQIAQKPPSTSPYFSHRSCVVPVVEKYLLTAEGDMLTRAISGAIHSLIHVGYGIEFQLDELVAEGLAEAAVHSAQVGGLFPSPWPSNANGKQSSLQNSLSNAFSSLRMSSTTGLFGSTTTASGESFAKTAAALPRTRRYPREGLSALTILDRMSSDPELAPGVAVNQDDIPRLNKAIEKRGDRMRQWCEEWKFSGDKSGRWETEEDRKGSRPSNVKWEECVEKCEELQWVATLIYAATSRPQYLERKLDFFLMHCLTSSLFLPSVLEVISPHLRPFLLHSHFRVMVGYWISRGRPALHIYDLMSESAQPSAARFAHKTKGGPPSEAFAPGDSAIARELKKASSERTDGGQQATQEEDDAGPQTPAVGSDGKVRENGNAPRIEDEVPPSWLSGASVNPWGPVIASAPDHTDDHVPKVIRALAYCATLYGKTPAGMYQCSMPGTEVLDGSVFIRAAGITMDTMGWMHEGFEGHDWDRSVLGFDEAWKDCAVNPDYRAPERPQPAAPSWGTSAHASRPTTPILKIDTRDAKGKGREDETVVDSFTNSASASTASLRSPARLVSPNRNVNDERRRQREEETVGLGVREESQDSEEEREIMG